MITPKPRPTPMTDVPPPTGQSHHNNNNNRRMALLEEAVNGVLSGNFDADSVMCLLTLMKVLDNVLQKPDDERVRSVRLANPTFQTKVVTKKGHFVLLACGFVSKRTQRPGAGGTGIGIGGDDNDTGDECLVLDPVHEDTAWIVEARSFLADVAVRQLGCDPNTLPVFVAPRARAVAASNSAATFDVYRGQRFDGQSASVGTDLGPPPGWKSDTERKLEQLERKKEALQRRIQGTDGPSSSSSSSDPTAAAAAMDRQWVAFLPGRPATADGVVRSVAAMAAAALLPSSSTSQSGGGTGTTTGGGDGKLLAAHFQQQQQRRLAEADRGFTTKAMRDLERLQKSKVYSHAVVQAQFPDGTVVRGCFLPHETIRAVLESLVRDVLLRQVVPLPAMELYQAPPRRLLPADQSLQELGLVPAAKVYVSWMSPLLPVPVPVVRPPADVERGWFLRPELFRTTNDDDDSATPPAVTMPLSVPVVGGDAAIGNDGDGDGTKKAGTSSSSNVNKRKMTKEEKEAALVARMLGGGRK